MGVVDPEILAILACPVAECRGELREVAGALECAACRRRYRIEQNWPVLIPEEAELPTPIPGTPSQPRTQH